MYIEKRLMQLETENFPKQFKTNQKIVSCIENTNINKQ